MQPHDASRTEGRPSARGLAGETERRAARRSPGADRTDLAILLLLGGVVMLGLLTPAALADPSRVAGFYDDADDLLVALTRMEQALVGGPPTVPLLASTAHPATGPASELAPAAVSIRQTRGPPPG